MWFMAYIEYQTVWSLLRRFANNFPQAWKSFTNRFTDEQNNSYPYINLPLSCVFMSKHTNLTKPNTDRKFRSYHQRWPNLNNHVLWNFANVKHCYCESIPCLLRRLRNFIHTQRRNTTCDRRSTVEQLCQVWIHISVSMRERVGTLFPFSNDAYRVPKGFKVLNTCQCFKSGMNHRNMQNVRSYRSTRINIHYRDCHCDVINTETEMLSFWWNFHHWLHWKLSFWQLSVQPVMKISSKWRHFRFSVNDVRSLPHVTSQPRGIVCYPMPRDDSCFWSSDWPTGVKNRQVIHV